MIREKYYIAVGFLKLRDSKKACAKDHSEAHLLQTRNDLLSDDSKDVLIDGFDIVFLETISKSPTYRKDDGLHDLRH